MNPFQRLICALNNVGIETVNVGEVVGFMDSEENFLIKESNEQTIVEKFNSYYGRDPKAGIIE